MKLREKPRECEAIQWMGDNYPEVEKFCGRNNVYMATSTVIRVGGNYSAALGYWILKDSEGKLSTAVEIKVPGGRFEELPRYKEIP